MNNWKMDATRILTRGEIAAILKDLHRKRFRRSAHRRNNLMIFRLAACCGLRASEIAGLCLGDVILGAGVRRPHLNLPAEICKGHKPRRVPLWWDASTLDDLAEHKAWRLGSGAGQQAPFVAVPFGPTAGNAYGRFAIRAHFMRTCRLAIGREATTHIGRHSFVSHAIAGGRTLAEVRDAAGHSDLSTTGIYTHIANEDDEMGSLFDFSLKNAKLVGVQ